MQRKERVETVTESSDLIEIKDFDNPIEFINSLSPIRSEWGMKNSLRPYGWIFRGQRNAEWALVPSAYREGTLESFDYIRELRGTKWKNQKSFSEIKQGKEKYEPINLWFLSREQRALTLIRRFAELSDRSGLPVSGYDTEWGRWSGALEKRFHDLILKRFKGEKLSFHFPPPDLRGVFALAQHYGIPTNLLDWTESSYVAAYFAASDAVKYIKTHYLVSEKKKNEKNESLCVWAVNPLYLQDSDNKDDPDTDRIDLFTASWQSNPNLRAQKGLFSVHKMNSVEQNAEDYRLENVIVRIAEQNYSPGYQKPAIRCYRTPLLNAIPVLFGLESTGTSASNLFPGYAGVTQELGELYNSETELARMLKMTIL